MIFSEEVVIRNTWNQRTNPSQHIWRVWDQNLGKKKILKFFHFDNLICILWSNLEISYNSASLVSCWHMSKGQPSQTVLKSVHSLALYDFSKFYLIYYPTAPLMSEIRDRFASPKESPEWQNVTHCNDIFGYPFKGVIWEINYSAVLTIKWQSKTIYENLPKLTYVHPLFIEKNDLD